MVFDPSARHLAAAHAAIRPRSRSTSHRRRCPRRSHGRKGTPRYPRVGKGQFFAVGAERAERREQVVLRHEAALLHAAHEHPRPQDMQSRLREGHGQQNACRHAPRRAVRPAPGNTAGQTPAMQQGSGPGWPPLPRRPGCGRCGPAPPPAGHGCSPGGHCGHPGALAGLPPLLPFCFLLCSAAAASQSSSRRIAPGAGSARGVPALTSRAMKCPSPP